MTLQLVGGYLVEKIAKSHIVTHSGCDKSYYRGLAVWGGGWFSKVEGWVDIKGAACGCLYKHIYKCLYKYVAWSKAVMITVFFVVVFGLQGCTQNPTAIDNASVRDVAQLLPAPQAEAASAIEQITRLGGQGWQGFNDAELSRLLALAFDHNLSLSVARQRLVQAEALAQKLGSEKHPSLDLGSGIGRHYRGNSDGENDISVALVAGYELDLWGRVDALTYAAELDALATQMALETAGISLAAEIAVSWFNLVEQQGQRALIAHQLQTNQTILALLERRFMLGKVFSADVLRQKSLITQTEQSLSEVDANITNQLNRLAVLTGRLPTGEVVERPTDVLSLRQNLPEIPELPAMNSLVSQQLLQRPDIRQAFTELEAADQRLAAAVVARYPRLNLSFSLSNAAESVSDVFRDWLASIAADIALPIIDGGSRRADVSISASQREEKWLLYQHSILLAAEEIETAFSDAHHLRQTMGFLSEQKILSDEIVQQLQLRYQQGSVSFLEVLNALEQQQQTERSLLRAQLNLLLNRVALNRALATHWQMQPSNISEGSPQTMNDKE